MLGEFTEGDNKAEESNIGKLLDPDKLKQEWLFLKGMISLTEDCQLKLCVAKF